MRRPRNRFLATTLVLALLIVLAACASDPELSTAPIDDAPPAGADTDDDAEPTPTGAPDDGDATDEDVAPTPRGTKTVVAYFARSGDGGVWVEPETHTLDAPTVAVARAAMEVLVAGETHDPGLTTVAPSGTEVLGVNIRDGVLIVDLSDDVARHSTGSADEIAFAQQLAHTAARLDGVEAVQLRIEGASITELWGHLDWSDPIAPDPYAVSPVTFTSHTWGDEVAAGPIPVGGEARVYEAHVSLRLVAPDGTVTESWTTAEEGAPGRGDWTETFTLDRAGTWTIEAAESDPSDGEGRPPFVAVLELEVTG